jgi:alkylation response protein AidB-like acyl-CoA dehydrogenase
VSFVDTADSQERQVLRAAVAQLGAKYGYEYFSSKARAGENPIELWAEAGKLGYLGVNIGEEYGGGGGGIAELSLVLEELSAAGCPLLMMVVSPAICGSMIARMGTDEQKCRWLPGLADGSRVMAFAITEPDAGSNAHKLATVARRDGGDWVLDGRKVFISGVDGADEVLVVGRTESTESAGTGRLEPALFVVPRDTAGFEWRPVDMELVTPERQFALFFDGVRLPGDARLGSAAAGPADEGRRGPGALEQLFLGLNPERIMAAAFAVGIGRHALDKAVTYVRDRAVWGVPIGAHQGLAHPLAQCKIELELARLMIQKAAFLYDTGQDSAAGEAANMAKYAAAEASVRAADQAVQSLGGNGLSVEYGLASLVTLARVGRVAPVSREMILNFVAQHTLGLPRSY